MSLIRLWHDEDTEEDAARAAAENLATARRDVAADLERRRLANEYVRRCPCGLLWTREQAELDAGRHVCKPPSNFCIHHGTYHCTMRHDGT